MSVGKHIGETRKKGKEERRRGEKKGEERCKRNRKEIEINETNHLI